MTTQQYMDEATELDNLRKTIIQAVVLFTQAPTEERYWALSDLMGEYHEQYLDHHQIEQDEIPELTEEPVTNDLPDNVVQLFKR